MKDCGRRPDPDVRDGARAGVGNPPMEEAAAQWLGVSDWPALWGFRERCVADCGCVAATGASVVDDFCG